MGATLQSTMQGLKPAADAKRIQLVAVVQSPPVQVMGDAARIQQVLWNLLHNAIKFTEPGGRVESSIGRFDSEIRITVQDTGRGIAPEFLPYVFERFRQEDSTATREHMGLGLGLSIAKHLVEAHGGTIEANSEGRGRGAAFTVRLPMAAGEGADSSSASAPRAVSA
jgi:signal transduction histidine kinase